jgi:two-component system chemotaxis sensor kinase CheA
VEPRVFGDFIEDTDYEFDQINNILKNKTKSPKQAMIDIYQSVHAIKSNALILGLENFSGKLHELENTIKEYRERDEVTFEDVLHITVGLEAIMKEKDMFQNTIEKLEAFKVTTGGNRRQDRYVLVETLTKACERAAEAQGKKVNFIIEDIDGIVLENGPRRVIKEVLTQLVRNAVYHGIEDLKERELTGKDRTGSVRLCIKNEDGMIHLKLSDDGKGLDFGKIRKKALGLKLLNSSEANEKGRLLQVIFSPGFSTAEKADMHAGRGIGLNLVRERVRDLHGSIKISTEAGKGTTFNVYIPMEAEAAKKAS